jgi:SOS response regulatory protein OraA/RecX
LEALRRLKPAQGGVKFSIGKHYPAWLEKMHKRQGKNLEQSRPIQTVFELEDDDMVAVSAVFGEGVLNSREFRVNRRYANLYNHGFEADEAGAVANAVEKSDLPKKVATVAAEAKTFAALTKSIATAAKENGEDQQVQTACTALNEAVSELLPEETSFTTRVWQLLFARVPKFFF